MQSVAIRDRASELYKASEEAGASLSKSAASRIVGQIKNAIGQDAVPFLHGDTLSAISVIGDGVKDGTTLQGLDQYRRLLSGVVKKNMVSNAEDAGRAMKAIDALDDAIEGLSKQDITKGSPEAVKSLLAARKTWGQGKKFEGNL